MAGQPITAAPWVALTYGLGTAVGAGVDYIENGGDPLDPAARWRASQGFSLEGEPCEYVTYTEDICLTGHDDLNENPDDFPGLYAYEDGYAFVIGTGVRCSTVGSPDLATFHAAADRQLELTQWTQIAHELMYNEQNTAESRGGRSLHAGATTLGSGAVDALKAISLLESAFAAYPGGPHLIHVPPAAITYLKSENIIVSQGSRWYTALGSLVVADNGYDGNKKDGTVAATGTVWLYGSGPISVRLDRTPYHPEPLIENAVTVRSNDIIVRSQKLAAVAFMCDAFAVQMTLADP